MALWRCLRAALLARMRLMIVTIAIVRPMIAPAATIAMSAVLPLLNPFEAVDAEAEGAADVVEAGTATATELKVGVTTTTGGSEVEAGKGVLVLDELVVRAEEEVDEEVSEADELLVSAGGAAVVGGAAVGRGVRVRTMGVSTGAVVVAPPRGGGKKVLVSVGEGSGSESPVVKGNGSNIGVSSGSGSPPKTWRLRCLRKR